MHSLLTERAVGTRGTVTVPGFQFLKRGVDAELDKVLQYYTTNVLAVPSDHLIVTILLSIHVQMRGEDQRYIDTVADESDRLAQVLQLTSPISRGGIRSKSTFYNTNVREIITAVESDFDLRQARHHWANLSPVRVLRHPFTDLSMGIANGRYVSDESGVAVINIDIPMLAYKYRRWCEEELYFGGEAKRTVMQFVAMHVLPPMLFSHFDLCVFNRMAAIATNKPVAKWSNPHPFGMIDYTPYFSKYYEYQLAAYRDRTMTWGRMLTHTSMFCHPDLFDLMRLPRYAHTRQIDWAMLVARMPLLDFFLNLQYTAPANPNQDVKNLLRVSLREIYSDKTLLNVLPPDLLQEIVKHLQTRIYEHPPVEVVDA